MIFGSISYLNLLPFQLHLKKSITSTQTKQIINWKRGVPSLINEQLKRGRVDSAFISSIHSSKFNCLDLGIVADGAVYSVFVVEGESQKDQESATSNILAKVLDLQGKVIIGDKALKGYLAGDSGVDLALEWKNRTGLPFVFARLCFKKNSKQIAKIADSFNPKAWKIPQYILKKEAKKRKISPASVKWYLKSISYQLSHREQKSLKLFLKKAKRLNQTP